MPDKFDQRVYLALGNCVTTTYDYRLDNRRLDALKASLPNVTHYRFQYAAEQTGSNPSTNSGQAGGAIHPNAPSDIGPYAFQYDSNGNQIDRRYRDDDGTRQIVWDEDNRMVCVHNFEHDHPQRVIAQTPASCSSTSNKESKDGKSKKDGSHSPEVRFVYNDRGERVLKESHENVSFYLNPHYTEKSDGAFKHILIGTTRLATKEVEDEAKEYEDDQYYYPRTTWAAAAL